VFVIGVPPKSWWMNVHPHVLHLHETRDELLIADVQGQRDGSGADVSDDKPTGSARRKKNRQNATEPPRSSTSCSASARVTS
jgi:hypothetical protein